MCVCVVVDSSCKRTVEEREREAKKGRRIRERELLTCQRYCPGSSGLYFLEEEEEKKTAKRKKKRQ